ncbi:MAG: TIGR02281 family clan AA aspartic protease [Gammaproteobacteria bacterium]
MTKDPSHNTLRKIRNSLFSGNFFYYYLIFGIVFIVVNAATKVYAAPHIEVIALFENKAMLHIDKDKVLVSVGEITKHGVMLVSADAHGAVIEINGVRRTYQLGNVVRDTNTNENESKPEILVYQGTDTMFRTTGSMNGYPVNFLVDTGASSIAMSSVQAKRLGINYKLDGKPTWVSTASGVERAMTVNIDKVTISGITIRSVEGLVLEGTEPSTPLLGMSYLNRFKIINDGNLMRLKRKY